MGGRYMELLFYLSTYLSGGAIALWLINAAFNGLLK
jgi:hypothetical protein